MGASGSFPIDIILFAMIAAFLVLRLRSILGRRQGFERTPDAAAPSGAPSMAAGPGPVLDAVAEPAPARPLPDPSTPLGQTLARMKAVDPAFSPEAFIAGAETAFRMIVAAFAAGDRVALRPLLSDETYRAFEGAIAAREAAGETQRTEIQSMPGASIESAELRNRHAIITMRFVSDQVNLTTAKDGSIVHGTDAVTEITDLWSFERELGSADPTWRLVAARSA